MKNEARALYFWKTFGEWRRVISLDIDFKLIKSNIWTTSKWIVRFIYRDLVLRLLVPCTVVFTGDLLAMPARHAMLQKRHSVCLYVCVGLADTHFLLPLLHRSSTGALSSSSTAVATVLWATQNIVSNFATFICCHCCSYCFYVFVLIKITNFLCTLSGGRGNCKVWQTHIAWVPFGGCSPIEANVRVPAN